MMVLQPQPTKGTTVILTVGLLAAGYVLGRTRPLARLICWADYRVPDDGSWWLVRSRAVRIVYVTTNRRAFRRYLTYRRNH